MNIGQTSAAIGRVHRNLGHDIHLINFRYDPDAGGDIAYADGGFEETDTSPQIVQGRLERRDADEVGDVSGTGVEAEETLYVLPDTDVQLGHDTDDEARASEFVDTQTDTRYRAIDVTRQDDLLAVLVEEL